MQSEQLQLLFNSSYLVAIDVIRCYIIKLSRKK